MSLLGPLLPGAVVVEARTDDAESSPYAVERAAVADAVESRRREFRTTRRCAREALRQLGFSPAAIPVGADRGPVWPAGAVGALTHCAGYRAAAVSTAYAGLGIDAETAGPISDRTLQRITTPAERAALAGIEHGDRLLFSAKESVYKLWHPLRGSHLGFRDVEVLLDPAGTFAVTGAVALTGRWRAVDGLLLTAVSSTSAPSA